MIVGFGDKLYAYSLGAVPLRSSWPTHRHDAQRTGRAVQTGIHISRILPGGDLELALRVEPGRTYVLQTSTNLADWVNEMTFTPETWNMRLSRSGNQGPNFYRLLTVR